MEKIYDQLSHGKKLQMLLGDKGNNHSYNYEFNPWEKQLWVIQS